MTLNQKVQRDGLRIAMMVGEDGDPYLAEGFNVEDEAFESRVYRPPQLRWQ